MVVLTYLPSFWTDCKILGNKGQHSIHCRVPKLAAVLGAGRLRSGGQHVWVLMRLYSWLADACLLILASHEKRGATERQRDLSIVFEDEPNGLYLEKKNAQDRALEMSPKEPSRTPGVIMSLRPDRGSRHWRDIWGRNLEINFIWEWPTGWISSWEWSTGEGKTMFLPFHLIAQIETIL